MLYLSNISKKFKNLDVLKSISCIVNRGDFVVIMGPNGTGKTTLFDIITGKIAPDQGVIYLDGEDITGWSEKQRASYIGRLFQNTYLGSCSALTVRENLAMATLKNKRASFKSGIKAFPEKMLAEFLQLLDLSIDNLLDIPMGALSGGQRQIISFMISILTPPKMMLLDEPTAALDPKSAAQLLSFAKNYAKLHRIPTLLITHDPFVAKYLGNRLWIFEEGTIKREFGPEKSELNPQDFFYSTTSVIKT